MDPISAQLLLLLSGEEKLGGEQKGLYQKRSRPGDHQQEKGDGERNEGEYVRGGVTYQLNYVTIINSAIRDLFTGEPEEPVSGWV